MANDDLNSLIDRQSQLESARNHLDNWWQEIALRLAPAEAQFTTETEPGVRRFERMFDGSGATANGRFAAVVEDLITPRTQIWNTLEPSQELEDDQESRTSLEELNRRLYQMRYRPKAKFAESRNQCYKALGMFGNYALMIHDVPGQGAVYEYMHTRECYWETDHLGSINRNHRKFKLGAAAAVERFKDKCPEKIATIAKKKPFEKFEFLHVVQPNEDLQRGRKDYRGMDWASFYLCPDLKVMIETLGYKTWPMAIGRYDVAPGEVYARGPAMLCWPALLTLNEEKKTVLRAGQKQVDPPILLSEDGALEPFSLRSAALNHGMVAADGTVLAVPFKTGGDVPLGLELMQLERQHIDDTFLTTVFKVLVENPQMTATQVLEVVHERAVLLAPTMGRLHSDDLGTMIAREIQILADNGWMPDLPDQLITARDQYKIEYQSTLARAMRSQEALAIIRMMELMPAAIQLDQNAAYVLDVPEAMREISQINGVPAKLVRDKDTVAHLAKQAAQQQQIEQAVAAAPDISKSALNAAQAEQLRAVV